MSEENDKIRDDGTIWDCISTIHDNTNEMYDDIAQLKAQAREETARNIFMELNNCTISLDKAKIRALPSIITVDSVEDLLWNAIQNLKEQVEEVRQQFLGGADEKN